MFTRWLVLVFTLSCLLACKSSGPSEPPEYAPGFSEAEPIEVLPAPLPLAKAGNDAEREFEVWTEPGELPFLRLAGADQSERLPLRHTHVNAEIHGLVAEVEVTQSYENPHREAIEVVYVFPLPENAAVNFMQMVIGKRSIQAQIDERRRARQRYETAKREGQTTALLEQERPNVFTQSVANIAPGEKVDVVLRYVQNLSYDQGQYEFVFPMVVGPRFSPGNTSQTHENPSPGAERVSPLYMGHGQRSGHDISIELSAHAGRPITRKQAVTHGVVARTPADGSLHLSLADADTIPNRDFVLRYATEPSRPRATLYLDEAEAGSGFFSLVVEPNAVELDALVGRREVVFVVDVSGSMAGTPLAMCRTAMRAALERLRPVDTFNIITFAGHTTQAFQESRPANQVNIREALRLVSELRAGGGTYMADAIDAALNPKTAPSKNRYVFFMTDGYVANEAEIIQKSAEFVARFEQAGARAKVFGFGVGSSPNRYLVSGLSEAGKGVSVYATNREDPERAVNQFYHYIDHALLTGLGIRWGGLTASQVYPNEIPDLFAGQPLVLSGRYRGTASGPLELTGKAGSKSVKLPIQVERAVTRGKPSRALGALWARAKVQRLEEALLDGSIPDAERHITELGLRFDLVTPFTSFVAVDTSRSVGRGEPKRIEQAVEQPEGVDIEMAGGKRHQAAPEKRKTIAGDGVALSAPSGGAPSQGPRPASPTSSEPASAPAEAADDEGTGYGYSFEDDGSNTAEPAAPDAADAPNDKEWGSEPAGEEEMAESDAAPPASTPTEAYALESKRGCGCRLVDTASGGGASSLAVLLLTLVLVAGRRRPKTGCDPRSS